MTQSGRDTTESVNAGSGPNPTVSVKRCRLRDDWKSWPEDKRADRLFMSCPACGVYGSHVANLDELGQ